MEADIALITWMQMVSDVPLSPSRGPYRLGHAPWTRDNIMWLDKARERWLSGPWDGIPSWEAASLYKCSDPVLETCFANLCIPRLSQVTAETSLGCHVSACRSYSWSLRDGELRQKLWECTACMQGAEQRFLRQWNESAPSLGWTLLCPFRNALPQGSGDRN